MTSQTYFEPIISFSKWLTDEMRRQGINITRLSERSGIPFTSISGYMQGQHEPSLFAVCCICDALGFSVGVQKKK